MRFHTAYHDPVYRPVVRQGHILWHWTRSRRWHGGPILWRWRAGVQPTVEVRRAPCGTTCSKGKRGRCPETGRQTVNKKGRGNGTQSQELREGCRRHGRCGCHGCRRRGLGRCGACRCRRRGLGRRVRRRGPGPGWRRRQRRGRRLRGGRQGPRVREGPGGAGALQHQGQRPVRHGNRRRPGPLHLPLPAHGQVHQLGRRGPDGLLRGLRRELRVDVRPHGRRPRHRVPHRGARERGPYGRLLDSYRQRLGLGPRGLHLLLGRVPRDPRVGSLQVPHRHRCSLRRRLLQPLHGCRERPR